MPYATPEGTFTFRSNGSVDAQVGGSTVTYAAGSNKAKKALRSALASVGEAPAGGKVTGTQVFDFLNEVVDAFKPSGQDTKAPVTNEPDKGFPWTAVLIGAAVVGFVGGGIWLATRKPAN
jgi:hypothetical protein